jgi:hypothetical protein
MSTFFRGDGSIFEVSQDHGIALSFTFIKLASLSNLKPYRGHRYCYHCRHSPQGYGTHVTPLIILWAAHWKSCTPVLFPLRNLRDGNGCPCPESRRADSGLARTGPESAGRVVPTIVPLEFLNRRESPYWQTAHSYARPQ